jgi:hypothetical protein
MSFQRKLSRSTSHVLNANPSQPQLRRGCVFSLPVLHIINIAAPDPIITK